MSLDQPQVVGDWLKKELFPPDYCRVAGQVKNGEAAMPSGAVVSLDGTDYVHYDQDSNDAKGILIYPVDASLAAKPCVVLVRGPAIVSKGGLTWAAANDAGEITEGLGDLLALGIVARDSA